MAVSSSTDFSMSAEVLVREARSLLGIQASEQPMTDDELQIGLRALNMMLKAWEAEGVMAWVLTEGSLTLASSDGSYTFSSTGDFTTAVPMDIRQMRVSHDGGNEIEMYPISREDYYRIPNRTSEGFPTQFYYERLRDSGTLYIWPEPGDALYDVTFTYRRRIMDLDAGANDFDMPQEWYEAVTYGLAKRLIPRYSKAASPNAKLVAQMADDAYAVVKGFDASEGQSSVYILPDGMEAA